MDNQLRNEGRNEKIGLIGGGISAASWRVWL